MKKFTIILSAINIFITVVCLGQAGSLDLSFGVNGKLVTNLTENHKSSASASAIQSDGKIVVAGSCDRNFGSASNNILVLRYNADGTPDISFGYVGKVITTIGVDASASSIAIQPDGKIVVAGRSTNSMNTINYNIVVIRYNTNGSMDNSFGANGIVITDIGGYEDGAVSVKIQQNGKIVVAGNCEVLPLGGTSTIKEPVVVSYNINGSVEFYSFAWDFEGHHNSEMAFGAAIQQDGKIVVAGYENRKVSVYQMNYFALFRYSTNGSPDFTFGSNGKVVMSGVSVPSYNLAESEAHAVAIQPDGKIIAAGNVHDGPNTNDWSLAVVRYNPNGTIDNTFGSNGIVTRPNYPNHDLVCSIALQQDEKIVIAGYTDDVSGTPNDFFIVRYDKSGLLDKTFGTNGIVMTNIGSNDEVKSVGIQQDGKIVVAGFSDNATFSDVALARYNINGSLDNTFSSDGMLTTNIGSAGGEANSVAVQQDGKIVVAGSKDNGIFSDVVLTRYNSNGSLDNTFNSTGKVITTFGGDFVAYSVFARPDGKIYAAGKWHNGSNYDFAIIRYNANGTPDNTFSSDGIITTAIGAKDDIAYSVIEANSKILVAGVSFNGTNYDIAITRYNLDGTPDNTFSVDGKTTKNVLSGDDYAYAIATQPDGKIVVAGYSYNGSNNDFAVSRFLSNGDPDNSFGTSGTARTDISKNANDYGRSLKIQADGKIIVGGYSNNGVQTVFAIVRYNTNGTLDNGFNSTGKATANFNGSAVNLSTSLALQGDGSIIMAGYMAPAPGNFDFAVMRYTSNGLPDGTFGTSSKTTTSFAAKDYANAVALQQDGKIVVAGTSDNNFAVARYNGSAALLTSMASNATDAKTKNEKPAEPFTIFPNPVISNATISFHNNVKGNVTLGIFDISGKKIKAIFSGISNEGVQRIQFSRDGIKEGVYFLRLNKNSETISKKILVK